MFTILQKDQAKLWQYGKKTACLQGFHTILQKKRAKLWQYGKSGTAGNVLHHRQGQRGMHCTIARCESTWLIAASWSVVHKNSQNPVRRSFFVCWPVLATVATWKGQNPVWRSPARDLFAVWCKQVYRFLKTNQVAADIIKIAVTWNETRWAWMIFYPSKERTESTAVRQVPSGTSRGDRP